MKKYEYCQVYHNSILGMIAIDAEGKTIDKNRNLITLLNRLGEQGWELVSINNLKNDVSYYFLKREFE